MVAFSAIASKSDSFIPSSVRVDGSPSELKKSRVAWIPFSAVCSSFPSIPHTLFANPMNLFMFSL